MRAMRRDKNEEEIVAALRAAGAIVYPMDTPVDQLVMVNGEIFLVEIKKPKKGRLTKAQEKLIADGWPVHVVRTPEQALAAVGLPNEDKK